MAVDADLESGATYPRGFAINTDWRWPMIPARDLVALNYGRALKADTRTPGKVPVYGTNGRCGWHDAALAKAPGLILGRKGQGPLGVEWTNHDFWVIDTAYYARPLIDDLDLKFLYHLVKYIGLNHLKDGTSNPTLSRDSFGSQLFPLPPLAEQRAIASVLGALDDKIELNRRMNATLESMARALFQSWFIDFDPVRAKLDNRHPTGMDAETAALFPDSFEDSELGLVPSGWTVARLREIAEIFSGGTPRKNNELFWNGSIPWISPKAMMHIQVDDSDDHVSEAAIGNGTRLVRTGTVLVMVRGMGLHQGVRISQTQRDVTFNQDVKAVVATTVPDDFIFHGLLNAADLLLTKVHASGHGTGVLSTEFLDNLQFVVPPSSALIELSKPFASLNSKFAANNAESRTLATLRDTLLPKLLSGELSVAGMERSVEAAL